MLENLKQANKAIGIKQSLRAVEEGKAEVVFVARDAEQKVTGELIRLCEEKSIEIVYVDSMKRLVKSCGIDVGASAAVLLKKE